MALKSDTKSMKKGSQSSRDKVFHPDPLCREILKSDLSSTNKITDLVNIFLRENPEFGPVEEELRHPSYYALHRDIKPWLLAQCDEEFDHVKLWTLLLSAAKEWFLDRSESKIRHIFCVRFELQGCVAGWNNFGPMQPVFEDFLRWHYGKESIEYEIATNDAT